MEQMRTERQHHQETNSRQMKLSGRSNMQAALSTSRNETAVAGEDDNFDVENEILQAQLERTSHDTSKVEAKITEISNLMSLFTTKVVEQNEQIETLQDEAEDTKENMKKGNEQLMEATKHMSGFRRFILLFLYFASFLLLFLDYMMD